MLGTVLSCFFLIFQMYLRKKKNPGLQLFGQLSSLPLRESTGPLTEENYETINSHTEKMGVCSKHFSSVCMRGKGDDFNVPDQDDEINAFSTVTH